MIDARRRALLGVGFSAVAGGVLLPLRSAIGQSGADGIDDRIEFRRVVAANRILANEAVVDAFGHVSVRDPRNPGRYAMSFARSPALVSPSAVSTALGPSRVLSDRYEPYTTMNVPPSDIEKTA